MKKLLALSLAVLMIFGLLAACQSPSDSSPAPTDSGSNSSPAPNGGDDDAPPPVQPSVEEGDWIEFTQPSVRSVAGRPTTPSGKLAVGENAMNVDFMSGWGNLGGNARVKELIYGLATVVYTADGEFVIDPMVVKALLIETNADGSKTYSFKLHENLKFSDGTPVKAENYAFAALLASSKEMNDTTDEGGLGAQLFTGSEVYRGALDYRNGKTNVFSGVRLLGDYEFSMTVDAETIYYDEDGNEEDRETNFPFYYQLTYASVSPEPIHIYAPGCSVKDDGQGVYIDGPFSAELLRSTIDNGSEGARYNPTVTTGPYKFLSFDTSALIATLEVNEYFPGDYEGFKPMIKNIMVKQTQSETLVDEYISGGVDMVVGIGGAQNINALLDYCDTGASSYFDFPRYGYGKFTMHCSEGPTQWAEVRRAIAYCMDREEICRQWTGGYGVIVHSRMGMSQWMYNQNVELVDSKLNPYTVNLDNAVEELVSNGWVLNENGDPYESGVRYKKLDDGSLMKLHLEWFAANVQVGAICDPLFTPNLEAAGFSITRTDYDGTSSAFNDAVYGYSEVYYHLVSSATGFATADSPWYYFDPDPSTWGQWNSNFIADDQIYAAVMGMKNTEPTDKEGFFSKWLDFVVRFNELALDLPIYSDLYHDFFIPGLKGYAHSASYPWSGAIVKAWVE
ncbi:MAG: ABC transporter substrate-binding protein [Oscillospiraceae bacterium]|jgi:peptide/nickel transport system substrate-binding protein|nr:ABC transporter substrate-binding protein [Oscillospiraceae bacterium]